MANNKVEQQAPADEAIVAPNKLPEGRLRVAFAYLVCALIWGTTWFAIRVCIQTDGGYPTFMAAALRFVLSATILVAVWWCLRHRTSPVSGKQILWLAFAGTLAGLSYGLLYVGEKQVTGGLAAVITALSPLITGLAASASGIERGSRATICGSLLALSGIAIVFHDQLHASSGMALALGSVLLTPFINAGSNVTMKRFVPQVAPIASNAIYFLSAASVLLMMSLLVGRESLPVHVTAGATAALLYLSLFGTLVAFACFFYLLRHVRLSTAMTLSFVTPIIALLVDSCFERQNTLSVESYVGIAVVLGGVALTTLDKRRHEKSPLS